MQMLEEPTDVALDPRQLLSALNAFKKGDFSVRMDTDAGGATGKVAAAFNEVVELNERLIGELERSDALLIATPMHNFTLPAALKLWIDYVLRIHRTFAATPEGKVGLMRDRPAFVIVGSGGFHCGEHARQRDFLTPYLRYALGSIGLQSLHFLLLQGLVRGDEAVNEALQCARDEIARHALFASDDAVTL